MVHRKYNVVLSLRSAKPAAGLRYSLRCGEDRTTRRTDNSVRLAALDGQNCPSYKQPVPTIRGDGSRGKMSKSPEICVDGQNSSRGFWQSCRENATAWRAALEGTFWPAENAQSPEGDTRGQFCVWPSARILCGICAGLRVCRLSVSAFLVMRTAVAREVSGVSCQFSEPDTRRLTPDM